MSKKLEMVGDDGDRPSTAIVVTLRNIGNERARLTIDRVRKLPDGTWELIAKAASELNVPLPG